MVREINLYRTLFLSPQIYSLQETDCENFTCWDVDASDQFGRSVTVSEDIIAIGAHLNDNENENDAGALSVKKKYCSLL